MFIRFTAPAFYYTINHYNLNDEKDVKDRLRYVSEYALTLQTCLDTYSLRYARPPLRSIVPALCAYNAWHYAYFKLRSLAASTSPGSYLADQPVLYGDIKESLQYLFMRSIRDVLVREYYNTTNLDRLFQPFIDTAKTDATFCRKSQVSRLAVRSDTSHFFRVMAVAAALSFNNNLWETINIYLSRTDESKVFMFHVEDDIYRAFHGTYRAAFAFSLREYCCNILFVLKSIKNSLSKGIK